MSSLATRPIAARRHDEIRRRIVADHTVSVEELARHFGVSRETIRRDLKVLAQAGHVDVVHGGAARREGREAALRDRTTENTAGKSAIGRAAAGLVDDGMVVLLDSGTTTLAVAQALTQRVNLTVCTTSLAAAQILVRVPGTRVHILGGEVDPTDEAAVGIDVIEALGRFRVDVAFIGVGGISPAGELTDYTRAGAEQRGRMIACADQAYFVVDHGKFGRLTPIRIVDDGLSAGLIVDRPPPADLLAALEARGLDVILAS